MTRLRFVALCLLVCGILAAWALGLFWAFGQPVPKGTTGSWQGMAVLFGPIFLAFLSRPAWVLIEWLGQTYQSLPSGRERRLDAARERILRAEDELAQLEREAGIK